MATYVMLFMPIGPVAFPSEIDKAKYTPSKEHFHLKLTKRSTHHQKKRSGSVNVRRFHTKIKWGEHVHETFRKILESPTNLILVLNRSKNQSGLDKFKTVANVYRTFTTIESTGVLLFKITIHN
jgi:hypothetical protein